MAILPVRVLPDPLLRKKAREVGLVDSAIKKLAADMIETMQAGRGVGLAAPQVGILRRVVTIQESGEEPFSMINPVISARAGERKVREGCLSVPGWFGMVTRAVTVTANAIDTEGERFEIKDATEMLAQAIEHEVDHLNGIVFTDHLQAHLDLWKQGEEPEIHAHDQIDFDHDAAHGKVLDPEERDELRGEPETDDTAGADSEMDEEEPEPEPYAQMKIYRQADLDRLDAELRLMQARLSVG